MVRFKANKSIKRTLGRNREFTKSFMVRDAFKERRLSQRYTHYRYGLRMRVFICIIFIPLLAIGAELNIGNSKITFELDSRWKATQIDSTEGIKDCILKREPITDRNNIDVIPNILIKVFKIISNEGFIDHPDSILADLYIMTYVTILTYAPLEVIKEYEESLLKDQKYEIPFKPSYIFVSNYIDDFKETHDCYYLTFMKTNVTGALVIIDSTQEVYKKIEPEVIEFINSIKLY